MPVGKYFVIMYQLAGEHSFFMDVSRNRNPHFLFEKGRGILSMSADLSRRQAKMPQYLLTKYSIYSIINYRNRRF